MAKSRSPSGSDLADYYIKYHGAVETARVRMSVDVPGLVANLPGVSPAAVDDEEDGERPMVPEVFVPPATWVVPVFTVAEVNQGGSRGGWRANRRRTLNAHSKIAKALGARLEYLAPFGVHFHKGGTLVVRIVRIGGRKMDKVNLHSALKASEDAVATHLGANDGADNWKLEVDQQPGPRYGVRIELSILPTENDNVHPDRCQPETGLPDLAQGASGAVQGPAFPGDPPGGVRGEGSPARVRRPRPA